MDIDTELLKHRRQIAELEAKLAKYVPMLEKAHEGYQEHERIHGEPAAADIPTEIARVEIGSNGTVIAYDRDGQMMPQYRGPEKAALARIQAAGYTGEITRIGQAPTGLPAAAPPRPRHEGRDGKPRLNKDGAETRTPVAAASR